MPELPEVEMVARALDRIITGRRIVAAELLLARLAPDSSARTFSRLLRGVSVEWVGRRGKHILIKLDNRRVLIVHLRMTGKFLYLPVEGDLPKHTHAIFYLDGDRRLIFNDQRQFGMMKIVRATELDKTKELRSLAPEPFSEEFTSEYLRMALSRSRRTLKETLLDQKRVVGLGNIYAAEVMFLARINPFRIAATLGKRRVPRLHRAIQDVLSESLSNGSTANVDTDDLDGSYFSGSFDKRWRVYGREGDPCPACGARIRRISHAGRSTFFCPRCQRR